MSFVETLAELNLSKNEALLYETLVDKGEMGVSELARESEVNRRNVYDTLNRLLEKGLVFEIRQARENRYKAVHPKKLREILAEKGEKLDPVIAELEYMYKEIPHEEEVYIYRGIEGWKNYLAQQLDVGENIYTIGGKGAFADEKIKSYVEQIQKQQQTKGIVNKILFDDVVKKEKRAILDMFDPENYCFLPAEHNSPSTVDIFGDYVVIFSNLSSGKIDEKSSFTVIKNKAIADSFRTWFEYLWSVSRHEIKQNSNKI